MRKRRHDAPRSLGAQLVRMAILMGIILLAYFAYLLLGGPQLIAEFIVQFYEPGPG